MKLNTELYDGIETVNFKITDVSRQKYFFPVIPKLRGKLIRRIEFNCYDNTQFSPDAVQTVTGTVLNHFYLNLIHNKKEVVKNYPAASLFVNGNFDNRTEIFNHLVDFEQSYIFISDTSVLTASRDFTVTIFWQDIKKQRFTSQLPKIKIDYAEAIITSATDTLFRINNYRQLNNKKIYNIASFLATSAYYTPEGRQILHYTYLRNSYLTLWDNDQEIIKDLPLHKTINDFSSVHKIYLRGLKIDWDKSYIKLAYTTGLTAGHVYYLPVYYTD